jgi:hypothetical protein
LYKVTYLLRICRGQLLLTWNKKKAHST